MYADAVGTGLFINKDEVAIVWQKGYHIYRQGKERYFMKSQEEYLQGLKKWLRDTEDDPLEEMADFFAKRLNDYEEHMSVWEKSYRLVAESVPDECHKILDLGCCDFF